MYSTDRETYGSDKSAVLLRRKQSPGGTRTLMCGCEISPTSGTANRIGV